ncbi:SelB C-terminal domain-containing protein [Actinokineospora auranticolor]|uniref:Selenocysteine-specific elongation factor n=1 Tax=Actinokineospora auranticolor TaxID=155976 RepID=A0A2S6GPZ2_9PSEU|nr:selenocysteine-specific translation elongation factor [Actinokineospora auranticolor]PPK67191.1 selenocysteine-specific elongation factor [Actinokineospora auranticolor]
MHVIATAGHVDHGKSTLVRRLTGVEPDRWAEERRRGLTIDLGFAWTTLPRAGEVAFVDVPGHERFVSNTLAGVGPAPAVLFVVAADAPWMPQAEEHLLALDALGVRHGLLVVTRADLADPDAIRRTALDRIARTSLGAVPSVVTGAGSGLDEVRAAVDALAAGLPVPAVDGDIRLWVDRSFTVAGAGTVVTGTLQAGTLRVGDELVLRDDTVRIKGLRALGAPRDEVAAAARVAVNLRGLDLAAVRRGDALHTRDAWWPTRVVDLDVAGLPRQVVAHLGTAAVPARVHPLRTGVSRLVLARPLPLRLGDRVLVRDPGNRRIVGATAVDLDRLARLPFHRTAQLKALGRAGDPVAADWHTDPDTWRALVDRVGVELAGWRADHPLDPRPPLETLRRALRLPDVRLVAPLLAAAGRPEVELPESVRKALDLAAVTPFQPVTGLGRDEVAAAVRAGRLLRLADGVVLSSAAAGAAAVELAGLAQPFTTSQARQALGTNRRIALALLDFLDAAGVTTRLSDNTRRLRART